MASITATLFDIRRVPSRSGAGFRTAVLLKGCSLRCLWCGWPEGMDRRIRLEYDDGLCVGCGACYAACPSGAIRPGENGRPAITRTHCSVCGVCVGVCSWKALTLDGFEIGEEELLERLLADREAGSGGIVFSGGEPLTQAEFVGRMAMRLKAARIPTALESSLAVPWENVQKVAPVIDRFRVDLKAVNTDLHRKATGSDNAFILENFQRLAEIVEDERVRVRLQLVPGHTATSENVRTVAWFIASVAPGATLELMPFDPGVVEKYRRRRDPFTLRDPRKFTDAEMAEFRKAAERLITVA